MLIPPERLIDGCLHTLREEVLPELSSRPVRGRLFAVLDVLNNLRDRIEEKHAPAQSEADSAEQALRMLFAAFQKTGRGQDAAELERALMDAPAGPPVARAAALRELLARTIAACPDGLSAAEQAALRGHLAPQALRDLALLKPSLLAEISKG